MNFSLVSESEKELIRCIQNAHIQENSLWKIPNLLIPLFAILLTFVSFIMFSDDRSNILKLLNLVMNGTIPLIAINQISGIGIYIFKYNKDREKFFNINSEELRTKLLYASLAILVLCIPMFSFQIIKSPLNDFNTLLFSLLISCILLFISTRVTKKIYFLQESFIEKTFSSEIRDEAKRKHGKNW